jgi:hypothetical protein
MKKIFIITIVLLTILSILVLSTKKPKKTASFITNRTSERFEDIFFIYDVVKYPSNVTIISLENPSNIPIGIVGDPWNLNFGILPFGVKGKRFVNVANYDEPIYKTKLVCYGNICPMIKFDKNDLILHKGEEAQITVSLDTSLSPPGDYVGEIEVLSERPKFSFLITILGWS